MPVHPNKRAKILTMLFVLPCICLHGNDGDVAHLLLATLIQSLDEAICGRGGGGGTCITAIKLLA